MDYYLPLTSLPHISSHFHWSVIPFDLIKLIWLGQTHIFSTFHFIIEVWSQLT